MEVNATDNTSWIDRVELDEKKMLAKILLLRSEFV